MGICAPVFMNYTSGAGSLLVRRGWRYHATPKVALDGTWFCGCGYFCDLELVSVAILLQTFWQILLSRKSPEAVPYSPLLLGVVLILHLLFGLGLGVVNQPLATMVVSALLSTGLLVGCSYLLLALHGMLNRFVQTLTAAAGCEIILSVIALPLDIWLSVVDKADADLPSLLWLVLITWNVVAIAHIWRHALEIPKWQGYLYAIGYMIISVVVS